MSKVRALAVVGPTASGKSELALGLAEALRGEIVCMDSMQVYRRMDIGTAKPTAEERTRARHHLLDIVEPTQNFAVADYAELAAKALKEIANRGRVPILTGGTGLYLKALMHGMALGGVKSDERVRARYAAIAAEAGGRERLHAMLKEVDAKTAARLHLNDIRRVIRALEICELTGIPMSEQEAEAGEAPFDILPLGLQMPRERLYERIERRVFAMMERGLFQEVRALAQSGVPPEAQAMQGIGYKELVPALQDKRMLSQAVGQIIVHTRHYAKRQETWFKTEPQVRWLDALSPALQGEALSVAEAFLAEASSEIEEGKPTQQ